MQLNEAKCLLENDEPWRFAEKYCLPSKDSISRWIPYVLPVSCFLALPWVSAIRGPVT